MKMKVDLLKGRKEVLPLCYMVGFSALEKRKPAAMREYLKQTNNAATIALSLHMPQDIPHLRCFEKLNAAHHLSCLWPVARNGGGSGKGACDLLVFFANCEPTFIIAAVPPTNGCLQAEPVRQTVLPTLVNYTNSSTQRSG